MKKTGSRRFSKRKGSLSVLVVLLVLLFVFFSFILNNNEIIFKRPALKNNNSSSLYQMWDDGLYLEIANLTREYLEDDMFNYEYLRLNGFSNFYLGISQISLEMKIPIINESIKSLRKAIVISENNNNNEDIYYILGKAYYYKGFEYLDLTIKYLNEAIKQGYLRKDIYEFKGLAYYELGLYDLCIKELESLENDTLSPELKYRLALSYKNLGEINKQIGYLLEIVEDSELKETKIKALLELSDLYFIRNDYDKSTFYASEVVAQKPDSLEAQFILGKNKFMQGKNSEAKEIFRRLLRLKPRDNEILSWLNK